MGIDQTKKITLLGAGLVGSLFAVFLAKRGLKVSIFESFVTLYNKHVYYCK